MLAARGDMQRLCQRKNLALTNPSLDPSTRTCEATADPSEKGQMLAIWRGQGWAVFPIYFGTFVVVMLFITQLVPSAGKEGYASAHGWPAAVSLGLPGFINIVWGLCTNWQPPVMAVDPENGMRHLIRVRHSFYYIPVEYWGIPGVALGALAFYLMPP
jgi:hypothetical protein